MEVESSEVEKLKMDSHRVRVMVLNMLRSTHIAEPHLFSVSFNSTYNFDLIQGSFLAYWVPNRLFLDLM